MKTIQLIEFLSTSSDLSDVLSDEEIIAFAPNLGLETVSADTVSRPRFGAKAMISSSLRTSLRSLLVLRNSISWIVFIVQAPLTQEYAD